MGERPVSRRRLLRSAGAGCLALLMPGAARARPLARPAARPAENVVVRWNNAVLQGVRDSRLGPPMVSRALAIVHTAIFDAWAAYDRVAVGTRLGASLRRPARERSLANKNAAISFAAYRAAVDLFPGDKASVFDPLMASLGYDPGDLSTDIGSDRFGGTVSFPAGGSRIEPGLTPANDLTLTWNTFTDAANQAGISRRYGGIHFQEGDLDARQTGRTAARKCWEKEQTYFNGTATPAMS